MTLHPFAASSSRGAVELPTATSRGGPARSGRSRYGWNEFDFIPYQPPRNSRPGYESHSITVVNGAAAGAGLTGQRSRTTGWRVARQGNPSSGTVDLPASTFSPNEKNAVCAAARACASGSSRCRICVNAGSVSISTRIGTSSTHGRNGLTAETSSTTSALAAKDAARRPYGPCQLLVWASKYAHRSPSPSRSKNELENRSPNEGSVSVTSRTGS
jgi:hypothetical protein